MKGILFKPAMVQAIIAGIKTQTRRLVRYDGYPLDDQPESRSIRSVRQLSERTWLFTDAVNGNGNYAYARAAYQPGDYLWIRESFYAYGHWGKRFNEKKQNQEWYFVDLTLPSGKAYQYAENPPPDVQKRRNDRKTGWYKRPSLFMPFAASRLFLTVTAVRVELLQDISSADAKAEGVEKNDSCWRNYLDLTSEGFPDTTTVRWLDEPGGCDAVQASYRTLWEAINGRGSWAANPYVWVYTFSLADERAVHNCTGSGVKGLSVQLEKSIHH